MNRHDTVSRTARLLQVVPLAVVAVFFAVPVIAMLGRFARIDSVVDTVVDPSMRGVWWFTFWQAGASTLLTVVIGVPVAWAVSRHRFRGSGLVSALVTVPFFMPAVVIAAGVKSIIPDQPTWGILWAHVVFNVAVVVRVVGPRWSLMDPSMEDTAADLGAGPMRVLTTVVLPYVSGAVKNAAAIVFVFCFTSFGVIAIIGGISRRTVESEVFVQAVSLGDTRTAVSLSLVQAVVVFTVFVVGTRDGSANAEQFGVAVQPRRITRHNRRLVAVAVAVPTVVVATPLVSVVVKSFVVEGSLSLQGYRWLLDGTTEQVGVDTSRVMVTSVVFALACASVTVTFALVLAFARNTSGFVSSLTAVPLVVSAVTLGLGLIITFDTPPFDWRGETWLIPVVHVVIALPLAMRTLTGAVTALPVHLRESAASLGAGPWRTWWRVEMPVLRPAVARAAGMSAAVSVGEFGATSFLSRSDSTTIPIAVSQLMGHPGAVMPQAAFALAALCVVVFTAVFAATV